MRTGYRSVTHRSQELDNISSSVEATSSGLDNISTGDAGASGSISNTAPEIENEDPEKIHIKMPRKIGFFERKFTRFKHFWKPEPTPMELEQLEQARKNARIHRAMVIQMMRCNKILPNAYANLGIEYIRTSKKDGLERTRVQRV